jgi:hypothetical protein
LCCWALAGIIDAMAGRAIRILLEVELDSDSSMTGRASSCEGTTKDFAGWLGLVNALQALLPESEPPTDSRPHA